MFQSIEERNELHVQLMHRKCNSEQPVYEHNEEMLLINVSGKFINAG